MISRVQVSPSSRDARAIGQNPSSASVGTRSVGSISLSTPGALTSGTIAGCRATNARRAVRKDRSGTGRSDGRFTEFSPQTPSRGRRTIHLARHSFLPFLPPGGRKTVGGQLQNPRSGDRGFLSCPPNEAYTQLSAHVAGPCWRRL